MQSLVLKLFKAQCLRHLKQHKGDFTAGSKIKDLVFKAETKAKLDILSGTVCHEIQLKVPSLVWKVSLSWVNISGLTNVRVSSTTFNLGYKALPLRTEVPKVYSGNYLSWVHYENRPCLTVLGVKSPILLYLK